jgi:hypothetical protein
MDYGFEQYLQEKWVPSYPTFGADPFGRWWRGSSPAPPPGPPALQLILPTPPFATKPTLEMYKPVISVPSLASVDIQPEVVIWDAMANVYMHSHPLLQPLATDLMQNASNPFELQQQFTDFRQSQDFDLAHQTLALSLGAGIRQSASTAGVLGSAARWAAHHLAKPLGKIAWHAVDTVVVDSAKWAFEKLKHFVDGPHGHGQQRAIRIPRYRGVAIDMLVEDGADMLADDDADVSDAEILGLQLLSSPIESQPPFLAASGYERPLASTGPSYR